MAYRLDSADPAIARALAHPRRQTILFALGEPATISQLAHRLQLNKGSVSHHLSVLRDAGLVTQSGSRTVRGGTEIYFSRVQSHSIIDDDERWGGGDAMVQAVADDLMKDRTGHLHHRTLRLTRAQADALRRRLDAFVEALEPAGPREATYGVVVGVYRRHG